MTQLLDRDRSIVLHGAPYSPLIKIDPHLASLTQPQAWKHQEVEGVFFYNGPGRIAEMQHWMNVRSITIDKINEICPSMSDWMSVYESIRGDAQKKVQKILTTFGLGLWGVRNAGIPQERDLAIYIGTSPDPKYPGVNGVRLSVNQKLHDIGITPVFAKPHHGLLLVSSVELH